MLRRFLSIIGLFLCLSFAYPNEEVSERIICNANINDNYVNNQIIIAVNDLKEY